MAIFSKSFWLGNIVFNSTDWVLTSIFIAFLVLAIVARALKTFGHNTVLNKLYGRLFNGFLTLAIIGGLWAEMRNLLVPYLGSRIVAGLVLLSFLIWLGFVLWYVFRRLMQEKTEWEAQRLKERYLKSRN
jgi:hypothetical protein